MDVLTFGESMISFSLTQNEFAFSNQANVSVAGAESNVAIALARLGHKVKWVSRLGDDPFGDKILYELNGQRVDTTGVTIDPNNPTGLMFKIKNALLGTEVIYYRSESAATKLSKDDIKSEWIKQAKIVHITGITPSLSDSCHQLVLEVMKLAKKYNKVVSFDPNIRLKLWNVQEAKEKILPLLKGCDIFFPGLDELRLLLEVQKIEEAKPILEKWGIKVTIVKDSANGAWLLNHGTSTFIPAFQVDHVVDEVGAGDAFAAGFLHGFLQKEKPEVCVKFGHALAAFAISVEGDTKGLPTKKEFDFFWNKDQSTRR